MSKYKKIGCIADNSAKAKRFLATLESKHGFQDIGALTKEEIDKKIDLIVTLGGDGFMLHSLHYFLKMNKPIYGMNSGNLGFLMNEFTEDNLLKKLNNAKKHKISPLKMTTKDYKGNIQNVLGFNEISLLRSTNQAAKLKVEVDGKMRLKEFVGDGLVICTPAGSSAYNLSAGGPILPISSNLFAMTPVSPFRPRRWRGALLNNKSKIKITIIEPLKRPISAVADFYEVPNIKEIEIEIERKSGINILFDKEFDLEEKMLSEQFLP